MFRSHRRPMLLELCSQVNTAFYHRSLHRPYRCSLRLRHSGFKWPKPAQNKFTISRFFFPNRFQHKEWELEKETKVNAEVLLIKSSWIILIFLPAFYLIIWPMTHQRNSEKISILNIWQLVFFWGVKTYFGILPLKWCIFRHGKKWFLQIIAMK